MRCVSESYTSESGARTNQPCYTLHCYPPVVLHNYLPFPIYYKQQVIFILSLSNTVIVRTNNSHIHKERIICFLNARCNKFFWCVFEALLVHGENFHFAVLLRNEGKFFLCLMQLLKYASVRYGIH